MKVLFAIQWKADTCNYFYLQMKCAQRFNWIGFSNVVIRSGWVGSDEVVLVGIINSVQSISTLSFQASQALSGRFFQRLRFEAQKVTNCPRTSFRKIGGKRRRLMRLGYRARPFLSASKSNRSPLARNSDVITRKEAGLGGGALIRNRLSWGK